MNLEEILLAKLFAEQVVSEALVDVNTLRFEEVSHIPAPEDAEANVIYLYKNGFSGFYDMYVLINGQVRRLDDTTVDLSSYAKREEIPTKTSQLINDSDFLTEGSGGLPVVDLGIITKSWEIVDADGNPIIYTLSEEVSAQLNALAKTNAVFAIALQTWYKSDLPIIIATTAMVERMEMRQLL